jgi:hypothetical protein
MSVKKQRECSGRQGNLSQDKGADVAFRGSWDVEVGGFAWRKQSQGA